MPERTHFRTGDQTLVREINLSLIMNRLHRHAPVSRAALAEMTGLNKSTVSSLVHALLAHGFVHEIGTSSSGIGRPSVLLTLNPQAGYIVSAEIGVGFILVICADFTVRVFWELREPISPDMEQAEVLRRLIQLIREAMTSADFAVHGQRLLGIALGVPGLVKQVDGRLLFAPNLGWREVGIGAQLREAFPGVAIYIDNEANLAALGEYFFGAAQYYDDILYISVGVGLGGAFVRSGQLMRGANGFAGELGHISMYPDGELCNCGNRGCWETAVSQQILFRRVREAISQGAPTILNEDELNIAAITAAARAGDRIALDALRAVGRELGVGIASLVNVLNPDLVLVGGSMSVAGEFLMPAVQAEVDRRALKWSAASVAVALARHGDQACVMGGAAVVYQTILTQPGRAA
jgi:glucokinase-like ROK family protein